MDGLNTANREWPRQ